MERRGSIEPKPVSPAQLLYAKKIAQGKGLVIPDEAKASSAAMSAWIDSNRDSKRQQARSQDCLQACWFPAPRSAGPTRGLGNAKLAPMPLRRLPPSSNSAAGTPLRIPYGNKDVAMKLGARYGSAGWYAPPGVDLSAFGERGCRRNAWR